MGERRDFVPHISFKVTCASASPASRRCRTYARREAPIRRSRLMATRARKTRLFPVAVSPAMLADVLNVRAQEIQDYIAAGLPCYSVGIRKRILVEDAVRFVRRHWKRVKKGEKK